MLAHQALGLLRVLLPHGVGDAAVSRWAAGYGTTTM